MPLDWQIDNKTYREQGSYRFTTAQRRSMELRVDVEIVSVVKEEYYSLKSNPKNGHFGYAVLFQGSTPYRRIDLEFPITRILQVRNNLATLYGGQWFLSQRIAEGLQTHYDCLSPASKICLGLVIADPDNIVLPGHPDTVVKIKTPPGSQFNIICYWVDIPGIGLTSLEIDPSDPGDGLDEYPEPSRNDPSSPWDGNPAPDDIDPSSDERDFSDENVVPPLPPEEDYGDTLSCSSYLWELTYGWTSVNGTVEERTTSGAILGRVSSVFLTGPTGGAFTVNAQSEPASNVGDLSGCGSIAPRVLANPGAVSSRHSFVVYSFVVTPFA